MILADTHAILWLTNDQRLLSAAARETLSRAQQEGFVAISDISLWEIALLVRKGRVRVGGELGIYLAYLETSFRVLSISGAISERGTVFGPTYPRDPADRIIGATAIVHGLRLVTKDARIRASGEVDCVW